MPTTDFKSFDLSLQQETFQYRTPMKFGGRVVEDVTVLTVDCDAESGRGRGKGVGSMTMGVAWAWPDPEIPGDRKLTVVIDLCKRMLDAFLSGDPLGHPLDVCHRIGAVRSQLADEVARQHQLDGKIPELAQLLAVSPIEAALFDAHGKAAGASSYQLLDREHLPMDLSHYLGTGFEGVFLGDLIASSPTPSMPLYHLVGALDPLTDDDVQQPVGDGLPETLGQWIQRDGLTHLKIKLAGDDLAWDVRRVQRVNEVADAARDGDPSHAWSFSLDFNERCEDEAYVLELLDQLESETPAALDRVGYIEQPTH
ncbi:MAG: hypothetical protein AAGA03_18755, partial [Planctomycetota bacterium]